jgi:hypothetical protein
VPTGVLPAQAMAAAIGSASAAWRNRGDVMGTT